MFSPEKRQAFLRAGQTRSLLWLCLLCFMPPFAPVWLEEGEEEARLCHALRPSVGPRASRAPPCPAETALGPGGCGGPAPGRGPGPEARGLRPAGRSQPRSAREALAQRGPLFGLEVPGGRACPAGDRRAAEIPAGPRGAAGVPARLWAAFQRCFPCRP